MTTRHVGLRLLPEHTPYDIIFLLGFAVATMMMGPLFILLVAVSIAAHELGHLVVGWTFGWKATEFSVGTSLPLLSYKAGDGETAYVLQANMLLGYVQFEEQDHPWWQHVLVSVAGPLVNLAIGVAVLGPERAVEHGQELLTFVWAVVRLAEIAPRDPITTDLVVKLGLLNVSFGVANLLPIPVLDGGRIWLALAEPFVGHFPGWKAVRRGILLIGVLMLFWFFLAQFVHGCW